MGGPLCKHGSHWFTACHAPFALLTHLIRQLPQELPRFLPVNSSARCLSFMANFQIHMSVIYIYTHIHTSTYIYIYIRCSPRSRCCSAYPMSSCGVLGGTRFVDRGSIGMAGNERACQLAIAGKGTMNRAPLTIVCCYSQ